MAETQQKGISSEVAIPEGATVQVENGLVKVKGPKGEAEKALADQIVSIKTVEGKVVVEAQKANKKNKKQVKTRAAHIRNLMKGATEGHVYKLKICSGHFPMNVALKGNQLEVKNFLGEKVPRVVTIKEGATVKVEGDMITVESASKETAGQVSADIETLTKRANYDTRIFQDGIYIVNKDGKDLA